MAQNGFTRRPNSATRTYPGTASRLVPLVGGIPPPSSSSSTSTSTRGNNNHHNTTSAGSEPTVFIRPLSRSQLAPVHHHVAVGSSSPGSGGGGGGGGVPPPLPPARPISLDQPRPSSERNRNLYLGAPILQQHHNNNSSSSSLNNNSKNRVDSSVTAAEQVRLPSNSRTTTKNKIHNNHHHHQLHHHNTSNIINSDTSSQADVVTTQPTKRSLLKSEPMDGGGGGLDGGDDGKVKLPESSIVCPYCRKCRCEACATPRPLPSRWICSKSVYCGPESLLDLLTCVCCVKAIFYHCGKNHEPDGGVMCADDPCSCSPHRKFWRWSCITAMSLLLPPLWLYWPCKGCIIMAEKVYQKYHNNGCNCRPPRGAPCSGGGGSDRVGGGGGGGASDNILSDGGSSGGMMDHSSSENDQLHHHLHLSSASSHHFSHPSSGGMTASGRIGSRSNKLLSSSD